MLLKYFNFTIENLDILIINSLKQYCCHHRRRRRRRQTEQYPSLAARGLF